MDERWTVGAVAAAAVTMAMLCSILALHQSVSPVMALSRLGFA